MADKTSLQTVWTRVNGLAMHAWTSVASPASAPPIVLVHGLGVSGRYLLPTAERLAADFSVYVPDLPGFGKSDKPNHILNIQELTDALASWMNCLGLSQACLVGNSLGCQFIVDLALRYPELIERAVLVGSTMDPQARTVTAEVGRGLLDMLGEPLSYWPIITLDYLKAGPVRTYRTLQYGLQDPMAEKLTRVQVPTLVVRGTRDPISPQRWGEEMVRRLPHGRLLVIPDATHVANYTAPDVLALAVREFVREPKKPRIPNLGMIADGVHDLREFILELGQDEPSNPSAVEGAEH